MHLEIQTSRKSPVGILRESYRDGKKIKHRQLGRITGKTIEELRMLQSAFRGQVINTDDPAATRIISSKEYGASYAILALMKQIGLDKTIYSRNEPWVAGALAMIAGRIVYAGSKLSLCNQHDNTSLFELVGIKGAPDVEHDCYAPLDQLLKRQSKIQKSLAKQHLMDGCMVLYDITSSYLEGEYVESELVRFGYNRDKKVGHKQIVIGLICNKIGCPVAVEVFSGNTKDESTVIAKINELKHKYNLSKIIFVGDRGMLTKCNIDKLELGGEDLRIITALTHKQINDLLTRKVIQPDLFDDHDIRQAIDPENASFRYCLCRNPEMAKKEDQTRDKLIELTIKGLNAIANYKQATTVEILGARVGKILNQYKVSKLFKWSVKADPKAGKSRNHQLTWCIDDTKLAEERTLDGCYIITTNVSEEDMSAQEVVASYKRLITVEQAFRNLKTVHLEMRPIYHKRDDRIKAHIFLCMLAYHVQFHMKQKLVPYFAKDGKGKNRRWSFDNVISTLKQITNNQLMIAGTQVAKVSEPTADQQEILNYLQVAL